MRPKQYICHWTSKPVKIDGTLNDPAWKKAPWTDDFVDIEGDKKPKPRFRTRAKMLWDQDYFYIGAELEEPDVWATLMVRDSVIFHDNDFEVFIDPNGDNHNYYEFEINALNTGWDLRLPVPYKDGGSAIDSWDIIGIKTAVHIDGKLNDPNHKDKGWSVEIAMPWKALGEFAGCASPPKEGDLWRLNFSRVEWKVDVIDGKYVKHPETPEDNWVWSPQDVIDMHRPERWGYIQFTKKDKPDVILDDTWDARELIHKVYYAERAFFDKNKFWAGRLDQLNITEPGIILAPTKDGFVASTQFEDRKGKKVSVCIRQDALVTVSRD